MGQRAALLLSELLLLLLTASRTLLAVSFPEDIVPLDVVDAHCEYTHANKVNRDRGRDYNYCNIIKKSTTILNIHFLLTPAAVLLGAVHIE